MVRLGSILVTGALAYDDICFHADNWTEDSRNIKLTRLESSYGGCAMNIAYNLQQLGLDPLPVVHAGDLDYANYQQHLTRLAISDVGVIRVADERCSKGIIFTGPDGTQTTAFYPGPATSHRSIERIETLRSDHTVVASIIGPDLPHSMQDIAATLRDARDRFWCPGQYADRLTNELIRAIASNIDTLIVNRHELQAMQQVVSELTDLCETVVVTDGAAPVTVMHDGRSISVDVPHTQMIDPTGCGDAFTAGFVAGRLAGVAIADAIRQGIERAARCLACYGAQAH
jgi:adenosine kinase